MQLRRNLHLGVALLAAMNLMLAFSAIALFMRMGPAIERILEDNVQSLSAAETMLAIVADPGAARDPHRLFAASLLVAQGNVTEDAEKPQLAVIDAHWADALTGRDPARRDVLSALTELADINREAMFAADRRAQALGMAGAWVAVFLGLLSFGTALFVVTRLRDRVLDPLDEVRKTLVAARTGDPPSPLPHRVGATRARRDRPGRERPPR